MGTAQAAFLETHVDEVHRLFVAPDTETVAKNIPDLGKLQVAMPLTSKDRGVVSEPASLQLSWG